MALLNFKSRFVEPIRRGEKNHTIRAERKIPVKAGEKLYLYCGLRHKGAFRILPDPVPCTKVRQIIIRYGQLGAYITIDGLILDHSEREQLAKADGFSGFAEFLQFWKKEHGDAQGNVDFKGHIIHWMSAAQQ